MTATMVAEIVETFDALEANDAVGAVVITGEPPAFCSGAGGRPRVVLSSRRRAGRRRGRVRGGRGRDPSRAERGCGRDLARGALAARLRRRGRGRGGSPSLVARPGLVSAPIGPLTRRE